ncbi:MAG: hypothetical protein WKF66_07155 [Pedobacter sp.]
MRVYCFILIVVSLASGSCTNDKKNKGPIVGSADTLQVKSATPAASAVGFNLDLVPISTNELGTFPYLKAPEGYKFSSDKNRKLEEKYYFYNDSLVQKVSGVYYHSRVYQSGDSFEDTYVVNQFTKEIEKLGGVQIYSGGLPRAAAELIDKEKPVYAEDMYDPMPYKYKQFIIRTSTDIIWMELCHGLNSNEIDLTIMQEKHL